MNERPAYGLSFPLHVVGLLVVPEGDEAAVPEVSVLGPFDKFKLSDELRFHPPALRQGRDDELSREGPDLHRGPPVRSREPGPGIGQESSESGDQP